MGTFAVPSKSVAGYGAMVVSAHETATNAGLEILARGGNAIDAIIAVNAVQGVVAPETCGVGGDLFALIHEPGRPSPAYLNASGRAGSKASSAALRDANDGHMPLYGPASVTVPGCVDGWVAMAERFGTLPLAEILESAIRLATEGFPASTELSRSFSRRADELVGQASASEIYAQGPPRVGDRIVRPFLATTLQDVASGARDAFYGGDFGRALVAIPGIAITEEDLAVVQADWAEPAGRRIAGLDAWTAPPNSQGHITLAALRIFEMLDAPDDPDHPLFQHLLIEAYRAAAWDRAEVTTDPRTAPASADTLLDDARLAPRAETISTDGVVTWPATQPAPSGTAYMCAVDADGLAVSLIQSNYHGIGSGVCAGATGVWLHNRGGGFSLEPDHPNEIVPGRRPLHTLAPTIWTDEGRLRMILGTRGGDQQPQLLAQVAARILAADQDPATAQAAPRWTTAHLTGTSRLSLERRFSDATVDDLRARGHEIDLVDDFVPANGPISVITVDHTDLRIGAADPRVDTTRAGTR